MMRSLVTLALFPATFRLELAFRLGTTRVVTVFVGELDETKGDAVPISPRNHMKSPA